MGQQSTGQLDTVMHESRVFPPTPETSARARIKSMAEYQKLWDEAAADPPAFWAKLAKEELHWFKPFTQALRWNEPHAEWFADGQTNASYNCLDKHVAAGKGDRVALIWEGEPGDKRQYTYAELLREVCKFANVLKSLGAKQGRRRLDLHAADAGARDLDARVRPDRGDPFGDLRRLLGRSDRRSEQRRESEDSNHRRRLLASWESAGPQANS